MKSKKLLACLLASVMVLSMAACGNEAPTTDGDVEPSTQESSSIVEESKTPETPVVEEVSVDFEDGSMSFVALYTQPANADKAELAVVDYNGSKQLQVKNIDGQVPYVAIDITSLLGADIAKVAQVEMSITTEYATGNFSASAGKIYSWVGEELNEVKDSWSVYIKTKNPNKAIAKVAEGEEFVADAGNIIIVAMDDDKGLEEGNGNATWYIDNIRFLDASGNVLKADSTVAFAAPAGFENSGKDYSNLWVVTGATNFEGFACGEGAWTQNGFEMTPEFLAALVPGSVIEIEYSSEDGNMWVVFPDSAAGWKRVGDGGDNGKAYLNNAKNVAQVTFEQIAAILGEDTSTWGARLQCEGSSAWEVFSVKVGSKAPVYALGNPIDFAGFACKEGAWTQNGFEMTPEFLAALVPGSVIELTYSTEDGSDLWVVFPDSAAGWKRVGDGGNGKSVCYNGKAYVTYEQIAAILGEDTSTWGARLQAEGSVAWEVYSVRVGQANAFVANNNLVEFAGFACKEGAWTQNGFDITPEVLAALVPGSVINIQYTSEDGKMWVVFPDSAAGWKRVGDGGDNGTAACDGSFCQVTYEQIAAILGEDTSTWGARLQCEGSSAWEVFSVTVGQQ